MLAPIKTDPNYDDMVRDKKRNPQNWGVVKGGVKEIKKEFKSK